MLPIGGRFRNRYFRRAKAGDRHGHQSDNGLLSECNIMDVSFLEETFNPETVFIDKGNDWLIGYLATHSQRKIGNKSVYRRGNYGKTEVEFGFF